MTEIINTWLNFQVLIPHLFLYCLIREYYLNICYMLVIVLDARGSQETKRNCLLCTWVKALGVKAQQCFCACCVKIIS